MPCPRLTISDHLVQLWAEDAVQRFLWEGTRCSSARMRLGNHRGSVSNWPNVQPSCGNKHRDARKKQQHHMHRWGAGQQHVKIGENMFYCLIRLRNAIITAHSKSRLLRGPGIIYNTRALGPMKRQTGHINSEQRHKHLNACREKHCSAPSIMLLSPTNSRYSP